MIKLRAVLAFLLDQNYHIPMKTFLYILTSLRDGDKDGVLVVSGPCYYHDQLLAAIEARDVEHAAQAINTKIIRSFDRSSVNLPTIYYTSSYIGVDNPRPVNDKEGYFFFSLKEPEPFDKNKYPDLEEKIRFKITAPQVT